MNARDWIAWAESELAPVSDSARLDAELLLAAGAGIDRAKLFADPERPLDDAARARLAANVARRSRGEPVAYILGRKEFYSLALVVSADVLVPRPETELLVDAALARLPEQGGRVIDLGTGSGAIALALKHERPRARVVATDCDAAALSVARANGRRLGLDVEWCRADWFAGVADGHFDLIVSNPPYIPSGDRAFATLAHEPRHALDGGADGLDAYRALLPTARERLVRGGQLLVEHGYDQREALIALAAAHAFGVDEALDDLAGRPRVLCLRVDAR
ncbi:MAG: peptide chain release factor N(5)-glutamine methyltransferase [Gammaproteobacteria bacterium]|nr:peptide chain release factor N(5)-glutamine methyltransferase [Gammaproteobacteria bacterium]